MRVLICDDEPDIRLLFRTAFEREGAEVFEAADGDECIAGAGAQCPDVVILDLMMPKRDGLSTLPMLRHQCPDSAVVVVTAVRGDRGIRGQPGTRRGGMLRQARLPAERALGGLQVHGCQRDGTGQRPGRAAD